MKKVSLATTASGCDRLASLQRRRRYIPRPTAVLHLCLIRNKTENTIHQPFRLQNRRTAESDNGPSPSGARAFFVVQQGQRRRQQRSQTSVRSASQAAHPRGRVGEQHTTAFSLLCSSGGLEVALQHLRRDRAPCLACTRRTWA